MGEGRACRYEPEVTRVLEERENRGGGGGGTCAPSRRRADHDTGPGRATRRLDGVVRRHADTIPVREGLRAGWTGACTTLLSTGILARQGAVRLYRK